MLKIHCHIRNSFQRALRRAPIWVVVGLACLLVGMVSALAAVTPWLQYQRSAHHTGKIGDDASETAPTGNALRWVLRTGGAVRSSAAIITSGEIVPLTGVTGTIAQDSTTLTVNQATDLHLGDPLQIGDDYLGPIQSITGMTVTVTYAATAAHTDAAVDRAINRQDRLQSAAKVNENWVVVKHPERFIVGDQVTIDTTDTAYVIQIIGATLTLDKPLTNAHNADAAITAGAPAPAPNGLGFVGSDDGYLYAFNPLNGTRYWKSNADDYLGAVRGAPVIDKERGRIYVASLPGRVFAFTLNGESLWAYPDVTTPALGTINHAPVLDDNGNLYVAVDGGAKKEDGSYDPPAVIQINAAGELKHAFPLAAGEYAGGLALYKNDAGTLRIVFGTTNKAAATGKIYSVEVNPAEVALTKVWEYATGPITAVPVVDSDGAIYVGDTNPTTGTGRLHAVYEDTDALGNFLVRACWTAVATDGPIVATAAVTADATANTRVVYVADTSGKLYAIMAATGDIDHTLSVAGSVTAPLTLDNDGKLLVSTEQGKVYGFDAADLVAHANAQLWAPWDAVSKAGMPAALPIRTAPALTGGLAIVGSDDGRVYAIGAGAGATNDDTDLPMPFGTWPFFHRDARHQGSLADLLNLSEPGPQQPTLRWLAAPGKALYSSPVVTDRTPDGTTRVYVGCEDGRIYAYDASTGAKVSQGAWRHTVNGQSDDGWVALTGGGAVRATPAVHGDGKIAVGGMDGRFYLWDGSGNLLRDHWTVQIAPTQTEERQNWGSFYASPVFSKSGMIYAATLDSPDTAGDFTAAGLGTLKDSDPTNGGIDLDQGNSITYRVTDATKKLAITRVRFFTKNGGMLTIDRSIGDTNPAYTQVFNADTTERYVGVDLSLDAQEVVWTSNADDAVLRAFEVFTTGTVGSLDLSNTFYNITDVNNPVKILDPLAPSETKPYTTNVETQISATWVRSITLQTKNAYQLTVYDANGNAHTWSQSAKKRLAAADAVPTDTIAIDRVVTKIRWVNTEPTDAQNPTRLTLFTAEQRTITNSGHVYAFDSTNGRLKWQYPAAGDPPLASVYSSPLVTGGATAADDVVYVATTGGQILALKDSGLNDSKAVLAWPTVNGSKMRSVFGPVLASPVQVTRADGDYLAVPAYGGTVHLLSLSSGAAPAGWAAGKPVIGTCSNTMAVTAQGTACLVTDLGLLYSIDLLGNANPALKATVPTSILSSPVIDSAGQIYFGSDAGALYCYDPVTNAVRWRYLPDRSSVSTTLSRTIPSGGVTPVILPVISVAGFRIGDTVQIARADGSAVESLGQVQAILPPINPIETTLTATVNAAGLTPNRLPVASTAGINVGDYVSILAYYDEEAGETPPPLRYLGTVTRFDATTIELDRDAGVMVDATNNGATLTVTSWPDGIAVGTKCYLTGQHDGVQYTVDTLDETTGVITLAGGAPLDHTTATSWTFAVPFAGDPDPSKSSKLYIGPANGALLVTQAPSRPRQAGDRISVLRGSAMPMRTSPAVGPAQTVYIGAEDGVLYAVGPLGPAGPAAALPELPASQQDSPWWTFHHDNQRTGYSELPGPRTNNLRWYRNTGSTLEASPALGYADTTAPLGVLYAGTVDERNIDSYSQPRGSLIAYNASNGKLRWRFDNDGKLGRVTSSPAVFVSEISDENGASRKDEFIVFGTTDMPESMVGYLTEDLAIGEQINALEVDNPRRFALGSQVFITDADSGNNFEVVGIISAYDLQNNLLLLRDVYVPTRDHAAGSRVTLQTTQQGHLNCVDRSGNLRWTYPSTDAGATDLIGAVNSSPVVDDQGVIYFGTDDGIIYAIDQDGKKRWQYAVELPDGAGVAEIPSSPALDKAGSRLFIGASVPEENRGYLLALDTATGDNDKRALWTLGYADTNANGQQDAGEADFGPITASPLVTSVNGEERIYIGTENSEDYTKAGFFCINPDDGSVVTSVPSESIYSTAAAVPEGNVTTTQVTKIEQLPAPNEATKKLTLASTDMLRAGMRVKIRNGGITVNTKITTVGAGFVYVDDAADNIKTTWNPATTKITLQTNEQVIIVGTLGGMLKVYTEDLTLLWDYATRNQAPIRTSPAISTETRTLVDGSKFRVYWVYFGASDRYLYAIPFCGDAVYTDTVIQPWKKDMRDRVYASPVVGMRSYDEGRAIVYQASRDQFIYAFGDQVDYDGDPVDPEGPPPDGWVPPEDTDQLVPSSLMVTKKVERAGASDAENPGPGDRHWWKFSVTVRNSGRGLVDKVKVYDILPDSLASQEPPVAGSVQIYNAETGQLEPIDDQLFKITRPLTFNGAAGIDDLASRGVYTGVDKDRTFLVKTLAGAPDRFQWSEDNGATWQPTVGTPIIAGQELPLMKDDGLSAYGIKLAFDNATGHSGNEMWKFEVFQRYGATTDTENKASWQIIMLNKDTAQPGGVGEGFTLKPDLKDPQQIATEYGRQFVFYVKVKDAPNPYILPDSDPNKPKLSITNPKTGNIPAPEVQYGDNLLLQLANHPLPDANQGLNQLFAEGISYQGSRDNEIKVYAHKETPVQNDWTDVFTVRLYYNGYTDPLTGKLMFEGKGYTTPDPTTDPVGAFSLWNQYDTETGEPLRFNLQLPMTISAQNKQQAEGKTIATTTFATLLRPMTRPFSTVQPRMVQRADAQNPNLRTSQRSSNYSVMPYAWRVTIQQGRVRMNQQVTEWGPEVVVIDRVKMATVTADATAGADVTITVDSTAKIRTGRTLLIVNPDNTTAQAYVETMPTLPTTFTVKTLAGAVKTDAVIYDEWSPDFTVASPVVVKSNTTDPKAISLGQGLAPGHTASSPTVTLTNPSRWNAQLANMSYRTLVSTIDLRHPLVKDWNADLRTTLGYEFGKLPTAGPLWDGFRYDPYNENYLRLGDGTLDLPIGAWLANGQTISLHMTRRLPSHQADSGDDFYASKMTPVIIQSAITALAFSFEDANMNGDWDIGERIYKDGNANGKYDAGEPCLAPEMLTARIFVDTNANQTWDPGEPYYQVKQTDTVDYGARSGANQPKWLEMALGISPSTSMRVPNTLIDLGRYPVASAITNPALRAMLTGTGNQPVVGAGRSIKGSTYLTTTGVAGEPNIAANDGLLHRTGYAGTGYTGTVINARSRAETMPMPFNTTFPQGWTLLKGPAGAPVDYGRLFNLDLRGFSYRQPTGTYTGRLLVSSNTGTDASAMISTRVTEMRLSQVAPTPIGQADPRPAFDVSKGGPASWTNYLTGTESWPTAAVLPGTGGDLGVWVASNTPVIDATTAVQSLVPSTTTDTNIWFRRAQHLVSDAVAFNGNEITLQGGICPYVRATADNTADLVILRNKRQRPDDPVDVWYGQVTGKNNTNNTIGVTPITGTAWNHQANETLVEISAHPWVPVLGNNIMTALRKQMADPGVANDPGPSPIRCTTPSVALNPTGGNPWLVWSMNATRTMTNDGKKDSVPFSFLAYTRFDPNNPTTNTFQWIAPTVDKPIKPGDPAPLTVREKPVMLPAVQGLNGMVLYEGGTEGVRGLFYALPQGALLNADGTMAMPDWKVDLPLSIINQAFTGAGRPQVWADSVNGLPETSMTKINLIFQGRRGDGNTDLYYARLSVDATKTPPVVNVDSQGDTITEALTANSDNTSFSGASSLAWQISGLGVTVNGVVMPWSYTTDTQQQYEVANADGSLRLLVDPYRGVVKVVKGTVNTVSFTGVPRLQRLTYNLAPDVNPIVSIERWRYLNDDGTPNYGADGSLQAKPRVWLYWVRQHDNGLGSRVYYRTWRPNAGAKTLDPETRRVGANNIDMPERMLPMDMYAQDGTVFITRMSGETPSGDAPEAGLWVLSTAARSLYPSYPDMTKLNPAQINPAVQYDLFLQALDVPVPDR